MKTQLVVQMNLREKGFPTIAEELYHCVFLARSFGEIPVVLSNRSNDLRPTAFAYRPATLYQLYCVLAFLRVPPVHCSPELEAPGHD